MKSLPLIVSVLAAGATAGPLLRALPERENYRAARVAFPGGVLIVVAALIALIPLALVQQLTEGDVWSLPSFAGASLIDGALPGGGSYVLFSLTTLGVVIAAVLVFGAALLGLLDDYLDGEPRGIRGHGSAALKGELSTGVIKALGVGGLALFVLAGRYDTPQYLLAVALVVLTTNLFNLLDLRPGRSIKVFLLLGAGLTIGAADLEPLWTLGLFVGPVLVLLPLDLRERTMLGDTGSNAIGALAGLWMVLTLSTIGQVIALVAVGLITLYGEFRSISAWIERTPLVRSLDSLGRLEERAHA